ncbi:MAG: sugar phosphate isomerase/epimerase family protein [Armatimonadota bacterium]
MPRFAICNETWGDLPLAETCRRIAAAGYDGVEIAPFTLAKEFGKPANQLTPAERQQIRHDAESAGLRIAGLHWLLVPPPEGLHLTADDDSQRQRTAVYLQGLSNLCADLGGTILVLGSPKQRSLTPDISEEVGSARFLETIGPCLETSEKRGVTLCLEPLGPDETNFMNTLASARRLITQADSPACRTIFDVKAAATENIPFAHLIAEHSDIIAHVHANDVNRRGPGFGDTDFAPIFTALDQIGYDRWVSVEVFDYTPDPDTIARVSLETLRAAEKSQGALS